MNAPFLVSTGTLLALLFAPDPAAQRPSRPAPRPAPAPAPVAPRPTPSPAPRATPAPRGSAPTPRGGDTRRGTSTPRGGDGGALGGDEPRLRPAEASPEEIAAEYFRIADYDGNGWITFTEGQAALALDRTTIALFDTDRDGRVSPEEFTTRYLLVTSRGGAFAPPVPSIDPRKVTKRSLDDVLTTFDEDENGGLDAREVGAALREFGVPGLDPKKVIDALDDDGSGRVDGTELPRFLEVLVPPAAGERAPRATSIEELFDRTEERPSDPNRTVGPARIVGPVSTFRRLDADADGGITLADLNELQRPLRVDVRAGAVLATLDADGDGRISPDEFRASMR